MANFYVAVRKKVGTPYMISIPDLPDCNLSVDHVGDISSAAIKAIQTKLTELWDRGVAVITASTFHNLLNSEAYENDVTWHMVFVDPGQMDVVYIY